MGWAWLQGTPGGKGPAGANLWQRITFSWPVPLINKGWRSTLEEGDAAGLVPDEDEPQPRAADFERAYAEAKVIAKTAHLLLLL